MKLALLAVAMVAIKCSAIAHGDELRIFGEYAGRELPLSGSNAADVQLSENSTVVTAAPQTRWRMEGGVRKFVHAFHWCIDCRIRRTQAPDISLDPARPVEVVAFLNNNRGVNSDGVLNDGQALSLWSELNKPAALVTIWVVGDAIAEIDVQPMPNPRDVRQFTLTAKRSFSSADAARCRVGLGVVVDGQFVLPRAGFKPQSTDADGKPLVRLAVQLGASKVLQLLLEKDPLLRDDIATDGASLMHVAAYYSRPEAAAVLARASAPVNQRLVNEAMPVRSVVELRQVLAQDSKSNRKEKNGFTPIQIAASFGHGSVIKVLLEAGAPPNEKQGVHPSTLEEAVASGDIDSADLLEASGAKLQREGDGVGSLLIRAARTGHTAMVRWLLVRLDTTGMRTALDSALAMAVTDAGLATALIDYGASPGALDDNNETALTSACRRRGFAFAEVLIARGAQINAKDENGNTALHFAASADFSDVARFLLAHGASMQMRNKAGLRALDISLLGNSPGVAAVLLQAGDRIERGSPQFSRLLGMSIRLGLYMAIQAAVKDGWSPSVPVAEGWSAIKVAEASGESEILALLRSTGLPVEPPGPPFVSGKVLDTSAQVRKSVLMPNPLWSFDVPVDRTIKAEVLIDAKGYVILPCFKTRPEAENLDEILAALSKWRFTPPTSQGRPVVTRVVVPIKYR